MKSLGRLRSSNLPEQILEADTDKIQNLPVLKNLSQMLPHSLTWPYSKPIIKMHKQRKKENETLLRAENNSFYLKDNISLLLLVAANFFLVCSIQHC